jgi:hypothetical protein
MKWLGFTIAIGSSACGADVERSARSTEHAETADVNGWPAVVAVASKGDSDFGHVENRTVREPRHDRQHSRWVD